MVYTVYLGRPQHTQPAAASLLKFFRFRKVRIVCGKNPEKSQVIREKKGQARRTDCCFMIAA